MEQDEDNQEASLPEDLLADILGRLAPRCLAVSRCICKDWKATIDARRFLLRTYELLPLRLEGIFLYLTFHKFPEFFSRPDTIITGEMDFLPSANDRMEDDLSEVQDHCNGLLLLQDPDNPNSSYVVNPATQSWDRLPDRPPIHVNGVDFNSNMYLAYDPMVSLSPHYEVFTIPYFRWMRGDEQLDPSFEESEWPPATFILNVFSSRTRSWEPRSFHRDGGALGTIAEMRQRRAHSDSRCRAVYRRATLYVHCGNGFFMRISLSDGMFRAIELPEGDISKKYTENYLGRSKEGVYFASLYEGRLRIWILNDPCGEMEWMLKHDHGLVLPYHAFYRQVVHGPWVLQDTNYNFFRDRMSDIYLVFHEEKFEWSSDDDYDVADNRDMAEEHYRGDIKILGFHPFKEIIFLLLTGLSIMKPLAYHYNSLKAEVLGVVDPTGYDNYFLEVPNESHTIEGFPYVPCWFE